MTSAEPELRLVLPSRAENVALVRRALGGVVEVLDLAESRLLDINAAVSEACNNVVVHAYGGAEGPMDVYLCIQPTELEVVVSDVEFDATSFDLDALDEPVSRSVGFRSAPRNTLERIAGKARSREFGPGGPPPPVARWAATTVTLETRVPA